VPPERIKAAKPRSEFDGNYAEMTGTVFENHVKKLLERKKWRVSSTPLARDGGIDLMARRSDDIGVEITLYIQCKNHAAPVGVEVIRALNGVLPKNIAGVKRKLLHRRISRKSGLQ